MRNLLTFCGGTQGHAPREGMAPESFGLDLARKQLCGEGRGVLLGTKLTVSDVPRGKGGHQPPGLRWEKHCSSFPSVQHC